MALITCPECGRQVSDQAAQCPNCGRPLSPSATPTPPPIPGSGAPTNPLPSNPAPVPPTAGTAAHGGQSGAPQVGLNTQVLKCTYCNAMLGPKDILSSGWAKCPVCKKTIKLSGANGEFDDNVIIEKLLKFTETKESCHETFMQWLMFTAPEDVFDKIKIISLKRKYLWVREFGYADERAIYPLCKAGKELFIRAFDKPYLKSETYEKFFPTHEMVNFNSEDIRDTEIMAKELSAAESRYEFSHTELGAYAPTPNYYCLPLVEEIVEYNGEQYTFMSSACLGVSEKKMYDFSSFPETDFLKAQPKYTEMRPLRWTVIGLLALILLLIIIGIFQQGFWWGAIATVIIGIIGAWTAVFVYGIISAITAIVDVPLCLAINTYRRRKFRNAIRAFQEHKRIAAKKNLNVDLVYEIEEYPIP